LSPACSALVVFIALNLFFATEMGTAMRAVGSNPTWPRRRASMSGSPPSAALVWPALRGDFGGALMVQSQGFADVNMGLGILINGLAALMIGEAIVGKQTVARQLAAPFVGAIVYYQLVSLCLAAGMPPPDLKLATGLFVLAMLALPNLKAKRGPLPARETTRE
jgi:putative ABC transport system permease protein